VNDAGSEGDPGVAADVLDVLVSSTLATKHEIGFLSAVMSSEALEQRQPDSGTVDKGLLAVDHLVMGSEDSEEERP
jgi:transcriptional regulator CtsR